MIYALWGIWALLIAANLLRYKTLLIPLVLIQSVWFFIGFLSALTYGFQYTWLPLMFLFAVSLVSTLLTFWNKSTKQLAPQLILETINSAKWLPLVAFLASLSAGLISQYSLSLDPISGFWSNGRLVYIAGYSEETRTSWTVPALLSITYFGSLFTPFVALSSKNNVLKLLNFSLPLLGIAYFGISTGSRNGLVLVLVMMLSSLVVKKIFFETKTTSNNLRNIITFSLAGVFIVFMLFISTLVRAGGVAAEGLNSYISNALLYLSGGFAAFGIWLQQTHSTLLSLGSNSFSGVIPNVLGTGRSRAYESSVYVAADVTTNIFTGFRSLIEDFGFIGAGLLLVFVLVFLTKSVSKFSQTRNLLFVTMSVSVTAFAIYLPFTSLFSWTSTSIALICFALFGSKLFVLKEKSLYRETPNPGKSFE